MGNVMGLINLTNIEIYYYALSKAKEWLIFSNGNQSGPGIRF